MSDIAPISQPGAAAFGPLGRSTYSTTRVGAATRGADQVQLSQAAQLLSKLSEMPDVRQDLVDRVRSEIAAGGYLSPEKIDAAIEEMAQDL